MVYPRRVSNENTRVTARDLHPGDIVLVAHNDSTLDPDLWVILTGDRFVRLGGIGVYRTPESLPHGATFEIAYPRTVSMRERDRLAAAAASEKTEEALVRAVKGLSVTARSALSDHDLDALKLASEAAGDGAIMAIAKVEITYLSDRLLGNMQPGDVTAMQFAGLTSRWAMTGIGNDCDRRFETRTMLALDGPFKGMMRPFLVSRLGDEPVGDHKQLSIGDVVEVRGYAGMAWEVVARPSMPGWCDELSEVAQERLGEGVNLRCCWDNAEDQMVAIATSTEGATTSSEVSVKSKVGRTMTINNGDGRVLVRIGRALGDDVGLAPPR